MQSFEQYDEICKYFAKGRQKDNDTNKMQKHLQLHDLSMGEYITEKYALGLDFRAIDENVLHGTGRVIGSIVGGITLQIKKKAETAGALKVYVYLIMDAQSNIQNGVFEHFCSVLEKCYACWNSLFHCSQLQLGLERCNWPWTYWKESTSIILISLSSSVPLYDRMRSITDGSGFELFLTSFQ